MNKKQQELNLTKRFGIDSWCILPQENRITSSLKTVRITPKVMQVLLQLSKQPGITVTRGEMLQAVWPDVVVTDSVLDRAISELRKIFEDQPGNPQVIETIPKVGYRMIAPVVELPEDQVAQFSNFSATVSTMKWPLRSLISRQFLALISLIIIVGIAVISSMSKSPVATTNGMRSIHLTTYPGRERHPAFSPDGKQVAFVFKAENSDNFDLYIKQLSDHEPIHLTETSASDYSPAWSPDGERIAFIRRTDKECGIFVIPRSGGTEKQLTQCEVDIDNDLNWSPDGNWLIFSERLSYQTPFRLIQFSPETSQRTVLTTPPDDYVGDTDPTFSPDGQTVAFQRAIHGWSEDIYILSLKKNELRRITVDQQKITGHDWTANGKSLIFASNRGGSYGLWKTSVWHQAGPPVWLQITSGAKLTDPVLSRKTNYLAYEDWFYDTNIWRKSLTQTNSAAPKPTKLIASTLWDLHPSYSPDATKIAFVSTRSGNFEIWLANEDGSHPTQLTKFDGAYVGTPRWSPSGRSLVFEARTGDMGYADLYIFDIGAQLSRRITNSLSNDVMPSWSSDGTELFFGSDRSGTWQIWRTALNDDDIKQITTTSGIMALTSVDGQSIYFSKPGISGIWHMPVAGGAETLTVNDLDPYLDIGKWLVSQTGIYYVKKTTKTNPTLTFYDFNSHQTKPIAEITRSTIGPSFSLSADNEWLLYTKVDKSHGDIMLISGDTIK